MKTTVRSGLCSLLALLMVCCAHLTKEDREIVNRAKTLREYPVSRSKFIKTLGLEKTPSERSWGSMRSMRCWYLETWSLPSGNLVHAWDSEDASDMIGIKEGSIDAILNQRTAVVIAGIPQAPPLPPARNSFESCVIASPRGKVFHSSNSHHTSQEKPN